jgi:glycerol-3-phosphate acyltransferase PlsY
LIIGFFPKKERSVILSTLLIILAYLMGSICSAVIVSKTCSLPDPRTEGSKNPGATNVLRLAGKKYAVLVLFTDLIKGTIPVLIARMFETDPMFIGFVALAAVIGHMYPVFFDFKGGKGVATAIGALLGYQFIVGVMVTATWLLIARFTRYSSLASIISICLSPFYALLIIGRIDVFPPLFLMALLILIKHKHNLGRLIEGTEPKIQLKQRSVIEEVMGEDPPAYAAQTITEEKTTVVLATEVPKAAKVAKPPKATVAKAKPTAKAKSTKKPVTKKATATEAKPVKKAATKKPAAKKPAAKKATTKKPKQE